MTLGRLTWHWPLGIAIVIIFSFCWPVFSGYGLQSDGSLVLYGAHYTDSINNIALIKSLKKSIPPENPNFSGNAVVSAVSGHPAFLGDRNILSSYGIDYSSRQAQIESFLSTSGPVPSGIRYLFFQPQAVPPSNFEAIYSNSQATIFRLK